MLTMLQDALAHVPPKFATVAGAAALAFYVDQQLLLTNDLLKSGRLALALLHAKRITRKNLLVCDLFEASVRKWPHKPCMRFEDRTLSFLECDAMANRVAHWALQRGLRAGQTVALLMENRPEYITVWLGLAKVGVVTALINTHLQADGLVHCIQLADTREIIVGAELLDKAAAVESRLVGTSFHVLDDGASCCVCCARACPEVCPTAAALIGISKHQSTDGRTDEWTDCVVRRLQLRSRRQTWPRTRSRSRSTRSSRA